MIIAYFNPEIFSTFNHLRWKDTDDIKCNAFYEQEHMRFDIVLLNNTRKYEVTFCFEPGPPLYSKDPSQLQNGISHKDLQKIDPYEKDWA